MAVQTPAPEYDYAAQKLANRTPLLLGEPLQFDATAIRVQWEQICGVLMRHRDPEQPRRLAEATARGIIDPCDALEAVLGQRPDSFRQTLEAECLDVQLGFVVLRLCALPVLQPLSRELEAHWQRASWSPGFCPACGSWPLLAEFRGLNQLRWLRCGLCAAAWPADRLFCPFCETRDHRQLQTLTVEGSEQSYRVMACDSCGRFLRGLCTLTPLTPPGLLVAELQTMPLELAAQARGYSGPPVAGGR